LVNAKGIIVHQRAGEGGYADLETLIRAQLAAAHRGLRLPPPVLPPDGRDFDPVNCGRMSEETYVGAARGTRWGGAIGNSEGFRPGQVVDYRRVARPVARGFHARGPWKNDADAFEHARAAAPLADWIGLAYEGAEVYAVMNVPDALPHRVYVTRDGRTVPPDRRGVDVKVDARGRTYIDVLEGRMYYVVQGEDAAKHELRLSPVDRGVRINSFTFGNRCLTKFERLWGGPGQLDLDPSFSGATRQESDVFPDVRDLAGGERVSPRRHGGRPAHGGSASPDGRQRRVRGQRAKGHRVGERGRGDPEGDLEAVGIEPVAVPALTMADGAVAVV
jgi:hypothetical protein